MPGRPDVTTHRTSSRPTPCGRSWPGSRAGSARCWSCATTSSVDDAAIAELLGCAPVTGPHLHLGGAPFRAPRALADVVRLFAHEREHLHALLGTNPHCRRLGPLPAELVRAADQDLDWAQLQAAAAQGGLSKYCDVNLTQLFADRPVRDTLEVRILPGAVHAEEVLAGADLVESLLEQDLDPVIETGAADHR